MNLEAGDQIQLSDGHTYLFLFAFKYHDQEYLMFSSKENEDAFRLGRYTKQDGQNSITFIFDENRIKEINDYLNQHPELTPNPAQ